jgi:hypothetical protein
VLRGRAADQGEYRSHDDERESFGPGHDQEISFAHAMKLFPKNLASAMRAAKPLNRDVVGAKCYLDYIERSLNG